MGVHLHNLNGAIVTITGIMMDMQNMIYLTWMEASFLWDLKMDFVLWI